MKQQLELTFDPRSIRRPRLLDQRRRTRAQVWFTKMRAVVDHAFDWAYSRPGRPEQMDFALNPRRN